MAKRYDFGVGDEPVFIGMDLALRVQVVKRDSAGVEVIEGDLTGRAYAFTLNDSPDGIRVEFTKASGSGITLANGDTAAYPAELTGANTVLVIAIADTDTDALEAKKYYFDVKRTDAGSETVVAFGSITFSRGISA